MYGQSAEKFSCHVILPQVALNWEAKEISYFSAFFQYEGNGYMQRARYFLYFPEIKWSIVNNMCVHLVRNVICLSSCTYYVFVQFARETQKSPDRMITESAPKQQLNVYSKHVSGAGLFHQKLLTQSQEGDQRTFGGLTFIPNTTADTVFVCKIIRYPKRVPVDDKEVHGHFEGKYIVPSILVLL